MEIETGHTVAEIKIKETGIMKILVATDGSECSNAAVNEVITRPWPLNSEVKLLLAVDMPLLPTPQENSEIAQAEELLKTAADAIAAKHGAALTVKTQISNGAAKTVIVDEAESWGADLIMVGSHGYNGLERFLIGSVSQAVALHARCSVEIVRAKSSAG
jgi:nucleotide-binding universal stress UspA family protein